MRFIVKVTLPVEQGNAALLDGSMMGKLQAILDDVKPEAVYFSIEDGQRTLYVITDIRDVAQIPSAAEPWWLTFKADVSVSPAFTLGDMDAIGPALEDVVKKWA